MRSDVAKLVEDARARNAERDVSDRAFGGLTPAEMGLASVIWTAMLALDCAMHIWNVDKEGARECIAEAYALLETPHAFLRRVEAEMAKEKTDE